MLDKIEEYINSIEEQILSKQRDLELLEVKQKELTIELSKDNDYIEKINNLKARGSFTFGAIKHTFDKNAMGVLDWGRGVWTYKNTWYWGAGTGVVDGKEIGFNIGYGFGDTSAASENMVFYDGKAHKLEEVSFNIPKDAKET